MADRQSDAMEWKDRLEARSASMRREGVEPPVVLETAIERLGSYF